MRQPTEDDRLDDIFHALANRTRRALVRSLMAGPARVSELAEPHGMSVSAISKHLFVLERAGLIRRTRSEHAQSCVLEAAPMATADDWLRAYRRFWGGTIDRLAEFVESGGTDHAADRPQSEARHPRSARRRLRRVDRP